MQCYGASFVSPAAELVASKIIGVGLTPFSTPMYASLSPLTGSADECPYFGGVFPPDCSAICLQETFLHYVPIFSKGVLMLCYDSPDEVIKKTTLAAWSINIQRNSLPR
jgi:hypothetical protein